MKKVFVLFVTLIMAASMMFACTKQPAQDAPRSDVEPEISSMPSETGKDTPTPTEAPKKAEYYLNEAFEFYGLELKIISVENTKLLGDEFTPITPKNNFAYVKVQATNKSEETQTMWESLKYFHNNVKYSDDSQSMWLDGGIFILAEVLPHEIATFEFLYDIPEETCKDDYIWMNDPYGKEVIVHMCERG